MKKSISLLILVLSYFVANSQYIIPKPAPDNIIHGTKTEVGGWVFHVNKGKPVQQIDTFYMIQPTWKQAYYYANQRKDIKIYNTVGIAVTVGLALFSKEILDLPNKPDALAGTLQSSALLGGGTVIVLQSLFGNAYGIKWNNNKWVNKKEYDRVMKQYGSTQPIWDSLETNFRIVDGPYPVIKK